MEARTEEDIEEHEWGGEAGVGAEGDGGLEEDESTEDEGDLNRLMEEKRARSRPGSRRRSSRRARSGSRRRSSRAEAEAFTERVLGKLVTWRDPPLSLLILVMLFMGYGLLHVAGYSGLTLVSFVALSQLVVVTMATKFTDALVYNGVVRESFDPDRLVARRALLTSAQIQRMARGLAGYARRMTERWEDLVSDVDGDQAGAVAAAAAAVALVAAGVFLPVYVGVFAVAISVMALGPVYARNQEIVDAQVEVAWERLGEIVSPASGR